MNKPLFICFTGIDGSGKSTNAKKLVKWLNKNNIPAQYIYNTFDPLLLKPAIIIKKLLTRNINDPSNYSEYSKSKRNLLKNPFFSLFYSKTLILEYKIKTFIKITSQLKNKKQLVCDRYFYDLIVTLALDLDLSDSDINHLINSLTKKMPIPNLNFLIVIPPESAYKRKSDIPSINFLNERQQLYLKISKKCNMVLLDGTKTKTEISNQIQKSVKKYLEN